MRNISITLAAAVLAALLAVSGCSKPTNPSGGAAPESAKPKLAGIVFQEDQFFRLVLFGMRDAAKQAGVEFKKTGRISGETQAQLDAPMIPPDVYRAQINGRQ